MSEQVTAQCEVRDLQALREVCTRLRVQQKTSGQVYAEPEYVTNVKVGWGGQPVSGFRVNLPCTFGTVVYDLKTGQRHYDDMIDQRVLAEFERQYALQTILVTAAKERHRVANVQVGENEIRGQILLNG